MWKVKRRVACQAREAETVLGLNSRVLEEAASADIFRTNSQIFYMFAYYLKKKVLRDVFL